MFNVKVCISPFYSLSFFKSDLNVKGGRNTTILNKDEMENEKRGGELTAGEAKGAAEYFAVFSLFCGSPYMAKEFQIHASFTKAPLRCSEKKRRVWKFVSYFAYIVDHYVSYVVGIARFCLS